MQFPEAAIAITLALGASGPETQCSLVWATNYAFQADVIVVQTHTGASCRGGARSDKGCDEPGRRGVAQ